MHVTRSPPAAALLDLLKNILHINLTKKGSSESSGPTENTVDALLLNYARSRLRSFELFSYRSFLFVTSAIPFSPFLLIIYIPYLMCELLSVTFIALDWEWVLIISSFCLSFLYLLLSLQLFLTTIGLFIRVFQTCQTQGQLGAQLEPQLR